MVAPLDERVGVVHAHGGPLRCLHARRWAFLVRESSQRSWRPAASGGCARAPPPDGRSRTPLATDVEFADGIVSQGLGLMFRRAIADDYALVFRFGGTRTRGLHMVCVPFDIDAVWLVDGEVTGVERLRAWWGRGGYRADTVIEMPAGAADGVAVGDRVVVE
ncbi:DUF192 domain-containing protein [Salinirubellus salinus]|uniref:DUF192 domain-containing protein n=1 Tax=Salinirubellus salinus TaxID=1364945 RepID=UPI00361E9A13